VADGLLLPALARLPGTSGYQCTGGQVNATETPEKMIIGPA
jgi:hypothetical protein